MIELTLKSTRVRIIQLKIFGKAVSPDDIPVYVDDVHATVEPNVGGEVDGEEVGKMEGSILGAVDGKHKGVHPEQLVILLISEIKVSDSQLRLLPTTERVANVVN